MKQFRRNFVRFLERNRNKGIPNLMVILPIIKLVVYFILMMDRSGTLYSLLCFNAIAIRNWELWRLVTFLFLPDNELLIFFALSLLFYFFLGRSLEASMGRLRFNLYFFASLLFVDAVALAISFLSVSSYIFSDYVSQMFEYSLLFAFAIRFSETMVRLFFVIPIKMKYLALVDLALILRFTILVPFPVKLLPISVFLPPLLFFFSEIPALLPGILRSKVQKRARRRVIDAEDYGKRSKKIPFRKEVPIYRQKCTVCGRTDVDSPELEFRYCSKCQGYHCYCMEHINNHAHIAQ